MSKTPEIPPLCGVSGAAAILGVSRVNMPHTMKTKGAPEPATYIDGRPYWLVSDIEEFAQEREKRKRKRSEGKM